MGQGEASLIKKTPARLDKRSWKSATVVLFAIIPPLPFVFLPSSFLLSFMDIMLPSQPVFCGRDTLHSN
ncbi:hypothetical protein JZ751_011866 [Albula glossodonta]|uniref:Uncharacterized protein n=1 Tax=Albula glossodonta TaxID=121402 RepID=A0A8T2PQW6_9TELE|nr:hypothetical protein JZ751_011866 [Albula glossodonta]